MNARHVYVHVPFCERRCSYCSFAIAVRRVVPTSEYVDAIGVEVGLRFSDRLHTPLKSLYLGGGTPSHLGPQGIARLIETLGRKFVLNTHTEITLEVNPEDVSYTAISSWRAAGINRISLGVQSFSDSALQWMHRVHTASRAMEALQMLGEHFENVSADLIFALPDAVQRNLSDDVDRLVKSGVTHISLYGLTAEPHTPFAHWLERSEATEAGEERYEQEFLSLHDQLLAAGFEHYEVSSFARPGRRSVHNSAYWSGVPYVGIGPSAHGYDGNERRWNLPNYSDWVSALQSGRDPIAGSEALSEGNRVAEQVYLGLRVTEGLELQAGERQSVDAWIASNWGFAEGHKLRLTALGWLRLDSLAASLTARRSR